MARRESEIDNDVVGVGAAPHSPRLTEQIARSAERFMTFLMGNKRSEVFEFPFGFSYPRNCCESVSIIFVHLLELKYRITDAVVIRGTKPDVYEHHFWVMTGGLLYDLTAQQFPRQRPIIGVENDAFFATYPEQCVIHEEDFVDREEVVRLYEKGLIPF